MGRRKIVDRPGAEVASDRSERITIRLTIEERQELDQLSQGVPASTYIRNGMFGYPMPRPRVPVPAVNREIYIELNRIGVNLNQQTKVVNSLTTSEMPAVVGHYLKALTELKTMLGQIQVQLVTGGEVWAIDEADDGEEGET
jgi:hypothetical protein